LELGPHFAYGAPEHPVTDPAVVFPSSGIVAAYAGAAILVFALYYVARVALMVQTLTRVPAQMAKRVDVAQGGTPKRPAGRFQPIVSPQFVPKVKLIRQIYYLVVWCAGVRHIAPERLDLVGRWYPVSTRAQAHLPSTGCSSAASDRARLSSSYEPGPAEGRM
jgi:hypothetical protein